MVGSQIRLVLMLGSAVNEMVISGLLSIMLPIKGFFSHPKLDGVIVDVTVLLILSTRILLVVEDGGCVC